MFNTIGNFAVAMLIWTSIRVRGDSTGLTVACPVDSKGSFNCPANMEWGKGGCYCRYNMQFIANGICVGVGGALCGPGNGCMYGSTCVSNYCKCSDTATEDRETGHCISAIGGMCFDQRNCARGQDCVNGKCQCGFAKLYKSVSTTCECTAPSKENPYSGFCIGAFGGRCGDNKNCATEFKCINGTCGCDFGQEYNPETTRCYPKSDTEWDWATETYRSPVGSSCEDRRHCAKDLDCIGGKCVCAFGKIYNYEYAAYINQRYLFMPTDACQIPLGGRCERKADEGRSNGFPGNRVCTTGLCNWATRKCECRSSAVPDDTGIKCKCTGASYVDFEYSYCRAYRNAIQDSTGTYNCPEGLTKNSATLSCDCSVKGASYNDVLGTCECGLSSAHNQTTDECECKGHSVMDSSNNNCHPFGNAQYDDTAKKYICPYGTHVNEGTGNCDWDWNK